jgi:hypothetical protein
VYALRPETLHPWTLPEWLTNSPVGNSSDPDADLDVRREGL